MKTLILAASLLTLSGITHAEIKDCEELRDEIAAKLDAKGVIDYELAIVDKDKVGKAKVVGSCDGGERRITYERR